MVLIGPIIFFASTGNDPCSASCYAFARQDDGKCCVSAGEGRCFCTEGNKSYYEDAGSGNGGIIGFCIGAVLVLLLCIGCCQRPNYLKAKDEFETYHNQANNGLNPDVPDANKATGGQQEGIDPTESDKEPSNTGEKGDEDEDESWDSPDIEQSNKGIEVTV